jgi:hypothetical protein
MLFTFACDADEAPVTEDRASELSDSSPDQVDGHHDGERGDRAKFAAEKLCAEIECSDEQAARIAELFASRHDDRGHDRHAGDREAHKATRAEANKAIAAAFAAAEFDASVLERAKPERDSTSHEDQMIAFVTELHGILTPAQRAALADKVEAGGGMMFGGHGKGMKGEHGKRGKKGDKGEHLARKVDGLCEKVTCSEDQKTRLTATFEGAHEAHRDAREDSKDHEPDFKPIAAAFRAQTLDASALRQAMAATKADHSSRSDDRGQQLGAVVSEIHEILTPAQRAIVAAEIEEHGVHALMGKGGKRHGKRGGHGKHGGHDKGGDHDEPAAD